MLKLCINTNWPVPFDLIKSHVTASVHNHATSISLFIKEQL